MDEIRLLNRFREDVPTPSDLGGEEERLLEAIQSGSVSRGLRARPGRLRPLMVIGIAGLAVAAAWAVALQLSLETPPGGSARATAPAPGETLAMKPVNAGVVLEKAAKTAESRPSARTPGPKQWQYIKGLRRETHGSIQTWEVWHRIDDRAEASYTDDGKLQVTKTKPLRETDPNDDDLSPGGYAKKLRELPTDPDKLLAHVTGDRHWIDYPKPEKGQKKVKEPSADRAFRILGRYLKQQAVMPPKLEAAIYRALSKIPDVKTKEGVPDGAGRTGIGVYWDRGDDGPSQRFLVLEPRTYRFLADNTVYFEAVKSQGIPKGAMWSEALLDSGLVDEPGERP